MFDYDDGEGVLFIFPGPRYMGEKVMEELDAGEQLDLYKDDRLILMSENKRYEEDKQKASGVIKK